MSKNVRIRYTHVLPQNLNLTGFEMTIVRPRNHAASYCILTKPIDGNKLCKVIFESFLNIRRLTDIKRNDSLIEKISANSEIYSQRAFAIRAALLKSSSTGFQLHLISGSTTLNPASVSLSRSTLGDSPLQP